MVMKATHRAGSLPFGAAIVMEVPAPIWARLGAAGVCYAVSTVNDWDHPRLGLRWHPGAIVVRWTARIGYRIRTRRDIPRLDLHRGPSHCIEWCALVGLLVTWLAAGAPGLIVGASPPTAPYCWWFGFAAFLGTGSHVLLDWMTPAGVPFSAIYNWLRYDMVWRRHACAWEWHPVAEFRAPGVVRREVRMGPLWRDIPTVGIVIRTLAYPTITAIPVDEAHEGCRPGLFYTDQGGEHMIVVPALHVLTAGVILQYAGILGPLVSGMTGWGA
jgi:hypothetical protein